MDLPDDKVLADMSTAEFDTWWQALGVTVRVAAIVKHRKPAEHEISNTSADTARKWQLHAEAPASAMLEARELMFRRRNPKRIGF